MKARIFSLFVLLVTLALTLILTWAVAAQGPQPGGPPLQLPPSWDRDGERPFRPDGPWPASAGLGVTPAEAQNVELVGQIGGPTHAVAVQGTYAYIGVGPRLVILDVSDPALPTVVGQSDVLPDVVKGVAVAGNYAYVTDWSGGLHIINVSNPAAPTETGSYDTQGDAEGVAVTGNYAYVADWYSGLRIVDVSNPAAPTETGFYDTPGCAKDVTVAGN